MGVAVEMEQRAETSASACSPTWASVKGLRSCTPFIPGVRLSFGAYAQDQDSHCAKGDARPLEACDVLLEVEDPHQHSANHDHEIHQGAGDGQVHAAREQPK